MRPTLLIVLPLSLMLAVPALNARSQQPSAPSTAVPAWLASLILWCKRVRTYASRLLACRWARDLAHYLAFSAQSVPGTYRWRGRRYIVIAAGGHGKIDGSTLGDAIIAFQIDSL
jgi:hypothetical protein